MNGAAGFQVDKPFEVLEPEAQTTPFVFNSPHSGRRYPEPFLSQARLDPLSIRRSEDHFVDELFAPVVRLGAPLLVAHFPRAYLDVNREPYELDPRMFEGALPSYANISSMRVAGGLGTIPRVVAENMEIYRGRIPVGEAMERVETLYRPYHACLRGLVTRTYRAFGQAVLVDCHSMPANVRMTGGVGRPDVIIGDRYGTSAAEGLVQSVASVFKEFGFVVARNKPYAGGFITEHYGRPAQGLHAIQVEINRGLYVDERTCRKTEGFGALRASLEEVCAALVEAAGDLSGGQPLAAE
ncbi:MAG: N-formylglutamate amidohydrolase [Pararhizobium sp.]